LIWRFPWSWGYPRAGWFISWKINLEMDDLGVPPCMETPVTEIYPLVNIQKAMENHHAIKLYNGGINDFYGHFQ